MTSEWLKGLVGFASSQNQNLEELAKVLDFGDITKIVSIAMLGLLLLRLLYGGMLKLLKTAGTFITVFCAMMLSLTVFELFVRPHMMVIAISIFSFVPWAQSFKSFIEQLFRSNSTQS